MDETLHSFFRKRRKLILAYSVFVAAVLSGSTFGHAALKPVLIDAGVYGNLCDTKESAVCEPQILKIDLMYIIMTTIMNGMGVFTGVFIDKFGPRIASASGGLLATCGALLFGLSYRLQVDTYLLSYCLLSVGGVTYFLGSLQLCNLFPNDTHGFYTGLQMAGWEASVAVFYALQGIYMRWHGLVTLDTLFFAFAFLCALVTLPILFLWPLSTVPRPESHPDPPNPVPSHLKDDADALMDQGNKDGSNGVGGANDEHMGMGMIQKLKADLIAFGLMDLALTQILACFNFINNNYYISTVYEQLLWLSHGDIPASRAAERAFSIIFPISGIVASYVSGVTIDRLQVGRTALVMTSLHFSFMVFSVIPSLHVQYVTFVCLISARAFFWVIVSQHVRERCPTRSYTTVYGIITVTASIVNVLGYVATYIAEHHLNRNFLPFNILLPLLLILSELAFASRTMRTLPQRSPNPNPNPNPTVQLSLSRKQGGHQYELLPSLKSES